MASATTMHPGGAVVLASTRTDALAAAPLLHKVQIAPSASTRTDALAAAPTLHEVQTAPPASARSDALVASSTLHEVQTASPASARSDALAASSPLHFMLNSISVNLDDPGSAEGGEDDAASTPALALATTTSTPALVTSRSSSRILRSLFTANAPKEDYNQHAFALLALVAELRERTGTLTLQPRAATNLSHLLASQHGAADKTYKLFSMAKFSLFVAVSLLAPITTIGKAPIVDNSTGFLPLLGEGIGSPTLCILTLQR
ncbi:hypothetical protein T492DRAFT_868627 [Pavlovales sp. CCMP2436]|nr:hypothetical protein T492DRAFT_868627 [Pavlovales sp. CCMP2436]